MKVVRAISSAFLVAASAALFSHTSVAEEVHIVCRWDKMRLISLYEDSAKDVDATENTFRTVTYLLHDTGNGEGVLIDGDQNRRYKAFIEEQWIRAVNNASSANSSLSLKINRITGNAESVNRYTPSSVGSEGLRGRSMIFYGNCSRADKAL